MGYVAREIAQGGDGDRDRDVSQSGSDPHIDELRLDSESIILEITPQGWCATKLTRMGWIRGSAFTISEAAAVLCAKIRAASASTVP